MQMSIPTLAAQASRQVCWLPLDRIQPSGDILPISDQGISLTELTDSIRRFGLLEPITVSEQAMGKYEILSGNKRFYACRMAGFSHIDAVVLPAMRKESAMPLLMSALTATPLHFLEEAEAIDTVLKSCPITQEELGRRIGKSTSYISQKLRLLNFDNAVRGYIIENNLSERHAKALLRLPDGKSRLRIAQRIVHESLSVRDTELIVESAIRRLPVSPPKGRVIALMRDHRIYLNAIRGIIEQMQDTGLNAQMVVTRSMGEVNVQIKLPMDSM